MYFNLKIIKKFFVIAIILFILSCLIISLLWGGLISPGFLLSTLVQIVIFFGGSIYFLNKWKFLNERSFLNRLFWTSFFFRMLTVILLYFWFNSFEGEPFGPGNWDEYKYHYAAVDLSNAWRSGSYKISGIMPFQSVSDYGYPVFLGLIYFIFGNSAILIPRIINAALSAYSAILLYKIFKRTFNQETAARLSAVFFMLMPNILYYTGTHLKETLIVFLVILFFERVDFIFRSGKIEIRKFLVILPILLSFFFLRTVLGLAAGFSIATFFVFGKGIQKKYKKFVLGIWFLLAFTIISSGVIFSEIQDVLEKSELQQEKSMAYKATTGNVLAKYGKSSVFAPIIFIVPFPTFVNVEGQQIIKLLAGGNFIKNLLSVFVLFTIIYLFAQGQWREQIFPLSFLLTYLAILTLSGFALSERFHLPVLPFWLAFAAYGIINKTYRKFGYVQLYLILIFLLILAWNWFKLAGRGMA